jgi:glycine cleavage system H protein
MDAVLTTLQLIVVFAVGLVARFALLLAVIGALLVPVALALGAAHGYRTVRRWALGLTGASEVRWMRNAFYAPGHTWAEAVTTDRVRVGLDDLAQKLLTGPRTVSLPGLGATVQAGETAGVIRCGDKDAEICSPVSGKVTAVNGAVIGDPSLINREPYGRGWLFTVAPNDFAFERFTHGRSARTWLSKESARLAAFLERDLGVAAADGGEPVAPAPTLLSAEQWSALTRNFLVGH